MQLVAILGPKLHNIEEFLDSFKYKCNIKTMNIDNLIGQVILFSIVTKSDEFKLTLINELWPS